MVLWLLLRYMSLHADLAVAAFFAKPSSIIAAVVDGEVFRLFLHPAEYTLQQQQQQQKKKSSLRYVTRTTTAFDNRVGFRIDNLSSWCLFYHLSSLFFRGAPEEHLALRLQTLRNR
ncbi:hypothetical protein BV898_07124 [Hypsibius exemplaris]|uniref:Secreted protein n=1 Tax=Hypsibius exemplaris TaxID=2072580 RepID=A0A1W0WUL7_HYPEX|nr:hypothetical protein BV898_07124 [Hypsibius exemplaris]